MSALFLRWGIQRAFRNTVGSDRTRACVAKTSEVSECARVCRDGGGLPHRIQSSLTPKAQDKVCSSVTCVY